MSRDYLCPECRGTKESDGTRCWYCGGTGYASEDADYQHTWEQEYKY